jgi:hypothetical protein
MNWADIMAERQKQAREREEEIQRWSREVTDQMHAERSAFIEDFTESEQRILGLAKCKA